MAKQNICGSYQRQKNQNKYLYLLSLSIDIKQGSTHYENNETKKMYELTKAIFLLAISAPILYGVNSLTNSVSSYPDPHVFSVDTVTISTKAYH